MRSYEAARSLFSFLAFIAWVVIIGGAGMAVLGSFAAVEAARWNGVLPLVGLMLGILPGLGVALLGFFALAVVQTGRAGVDSAEYGQQMLQIARNHLDVSKQTLQQGEAVKRGFETLRTAPAEPTSATYADLAAAPAKPVAPPKAVVPKTIAYQGKTVAALEDGFEFAGVRFESLRAVMAYIDQFALDATSSVSAPS